ncbi:hypothetical protein ACLOJK_011112 [Asimina triloba]
MSSFTWYQTARIFDTCGNRDEGFENLSEGDGTSDFRGDGERDRPLTQFQPKARDGLNDARLQSAAYGHVVPPVGIRHVSETSSFVTPLVGSGMDETMTSPNATSDAPGFFAKRNCHATNRLQLTKWLKS